MRHGSSQQNKTGWQQTATLQSPGPATTPPTEVLVPGGIVPLLNAQFAEPDCYTLSFSLQLISPLPAIQPSGTTIVGGKVVPVAPVPQPVVTASTEGVRCLAIISWSVEGATVKRVIDVGNGVSISMVAQAVSVQLQDVTYSIAGNTGIQYSVTGTVSQGTRPATALPPVLYSGIYDVPNGPAGISIPFGNIDGVLELLSFPDAGITSVEVVGLDTSTPGAGINSLWVNLYNVTVTKQYSPGNAPGFVKVPPGTTILQLINHLAGPDAASMTVTWGIDG